MCARSKIHAFNFMDPPEWQRTVVTPMKVSVRLSLSKERPSAPPSPSRKKKSAGAKPGVECQRCSMLWSANHCLRKGAMATGAGSEWKNHSFCRGSKDRLCVTGNGSPQLILREKPLLYLLFILGQSTQLIFSPRLSESAVGRYFKSLLCF